MATNDGTDLFTDDLDVIGAQAHADIVLLKDAANKYPLDSDGEHTASPL